eukprot:14460042-Heterocapsa_arctica.AAC.1
MRATIDAELRIVWGDTLQEGSGWVRYLGKEWQCRRGCYSERVPPTYWEERLAEMGMTSCKSVSTPAELNDKPDENSPLLGDADHSTFRRAVGKAMYGCS